jgi:hypothetical protein
MIMLLKEIPGGQKEWFKINYCLGKKEMPEGFDSKDFFNQIIGMEDIRLKDYKGDSEDFNDQIILATNFSIESAKKVNFLVVQLSYLLSECIEKEFYELSGNIQIVLAQFCNVIDELNVSNNVKNLIRELDIKVSNCWTHA